MSKQSGVMRPRGTSMGNQAGGTCWVGKLRTCTRVFFGRVGFGVVRPDSASPSPLVLTFLPNATFSALAFSAAARRASAARSVFSTSAVRVRSASSLAFAAFKAFTVCLRAASRAETPRAVSPSAPGASEDLRIDAAYAPPSEDSGGRSRAGAERLRPSR
jgi:hypothetical protein